MIFCIKIYIYIVLFFFLFKPQHPQESGETKEEEKKKWHLFFAELPPPPLDVWSESSSETCYKFILWNADGRQSESERRHRLIDPDRCWINMRDELAWERCEIQQGEPHSNKVGCGGAIKICHVPQIIQKPLGKQQRCSSVDDKGHYVQTQRH